MAAPSLTIIGKQSGAAILRNEQSEILERFVKQVRDVIPAAADKNQLALVDSLPTFLEHLILRLAEVEGRATGRHHIHLVSETHAEERVGMGDYTLEQLIREYGVFRSIVIDTIGRHGAIDPALLLMVNQLIDEGVAFAGKKFAERTSAQKMERTEQALRTFRELVDRTPQILWSTSSAGQGEYFNHQWTAYTGLSEEESLGEGWKAAIHPEDIVSTTGHWKRAAKDHAPFALEERVRRKDGEYRWHQVRVSPAIAPDGRLRWYGVSTDIHDQKENSQGLSQLVDELTHERRIRESFMATLTHDMRSPLQAASAAAELIVRYPEKKDRHGTWAAKTIESLERIDRMIDDLLDANRIRAGQGISLRKSEVNIAVLVQETVDDLNLSSENRIRFESKHGEIPAEIQVDRDGVRRVLENLISNAVKYGEAGTPVVVTLGGDAERIQITVHNLGNEIDEEMQKVLFEPFKRSTATSVKGKKGWGLGLTLVKGIVEAHAGQVNVRSAPGKGTTFTVSLPRRP